MTELDDHELLAAYARTESEAAFATLVARHVNLVHSAALRFTGNSHHAGEITQAVFILLARKAGGLGRHVVVSGWLYQTARLTAANFTKGEIRRQQREQEAYMQSTLNEPADTAWQQIAPLLDEAMGRLGEADRNALVLRYFENKSAAEIGGALNLNEAAAHKRVHRALEKLRKFFTRRGIALSATALAGAVSANAVSAAPAGLAVTLTAAAQGALISATVTTLVKQTMNTLTWIKFKFTAAVVSAVLLAGGVATVAISQTGDHQPVPGDATAREILQKSQTAYAALTSYRDRGQVVSQIAGQTISNTFNIRLQRPNLYRVEWQQTTAFFSSGGVVWSAGNGDYLVLEHGQNNVQPERQPDMPTALGAATGVSGQASATIPGTFFQQNWGDALKFRAAGNTPLTQLPDDTVAGVDCYVVSSASSSISLPNNGGQTGKTTTTLWIGKQDYLIHQKQEVTEGASFKPPVMTDARIAAILTRQNHPATPEAIASLRKIIETGQQKVQKQMASGKVVNTETHDQIELNPALTAADFAR